ncbi:hypothetical protein PAXINDRAFT_174430 [Paxillus involutus ATCC 200175]|nr:hypothetical protein PAXINDRAFT_174430 [Paxillus involutus ATCC 200175]
MNSMHDNHKRTSISQLLNPSSDSSGYSHVTHLPSSPGVSQYQHPQHPPHGPYPQQTESGSSFHLRAASWEPVNDDQAAPKRRPDAGPTVARSYPMPPHMYAEMNGDMPSRQQRPRMDEHGNYAIAAGAWPVQPEVSTVPYGSPAVAPMYSDERTAISGDFAQNNQYNQNSQEHHPQPMHPHHTSLQHAERASVRVAARFTAPIPGQPVFEVGALMHPPPGMFSAMLYQHPPPPPQVQKRPSTEVEELPSQKSRKAKKAKVTEGNASSKRGYNARKRSEAAQIAAQSAQLMPTVSYTSASVDKGKEKAGEAPMRIVTAENGGQETSAPLHPELQFARCMSNRYRSEQFPRCVSCTRRWAGDTCRFQGIRFFLKDGQRNIVGISFVENQRPDAPSMSFPVQWNVPLTEQHIRRTKRTIAQALLPTLRQELDHLAYPEIIRRTRESEVRATCDTCMTSIFSCSWMCRLCGREACAECFEQVKELTEDKPGATQAEIAALQARREKHAHTNPFFLSCTRRNEHHAKDFSPMSRFCKSELAQAIKDMEALMKQTDVDALPVIGAIDPALQNGQSEPNDSASAALNNPAADSSNSETPAPSTLDPALPQIEAITSDSTSDQANGATTKTDTQLHPASGPAQTDPSGLPFHPTTTIPDSELTEEVFRPLWSKGDPIVVTGLLPKFQIQWTPEYFLQKYNSQSCLILECQSDVNKRVTVGEFFSWFGKYEGRVECWKLKDWPPSTDFKTAFPELFEDFSKAVPVPTYVRRDGALNIASHFPSNTVAPDLGPKMYNAMASFESVGSKGSTRLHMDMADAINIMTSAAPTPDGKPGCAAWDLFRACDADKLRTFLRRKFKGSYQHDPIHSQQFYLDSTLREELFEMYGIKSHRVYQRPGEAVLIPAGCAHQVCNLADCVKVAVDFVSPENIARCEQLTKEFREQNQSMAWKEDVLQLRTMMWFAWLSCSRQEKEMNET